MVELKEIYNVNKENRVSVVHGRSKQTIRRAVSQARWNASSLYRANSALPGAGDHSPFLQALPPRLVFSITSARKIRHSSLFRKHFRKHGLPVPEILCGRPETRTHISNRISGILLPFWNSLSKNRSGDQIDSAVIEAYRKAVAVLPRFQVEAGQDLDYSVCYPRGKFRSLTDQLGPELL